MRCASCLFMLRSSVKRQPPNVGTSEAGVKYMLSTGKAREAKCIVYIEEHAVTRYSVPIPTPVMPSIARVSRRAEGARSQRRVIERLRQQRRRERAVLAVLAVREGRVVLRAHPRWFEVGDHVDQEHE